uniref:Transposase n=1 Tax=Steinernema glaseri TaxID=37863 RepID=A0A1I7YQ06_9BILA
MSNALTENNVTCSVNGEQDSKCGEWPLTQIRNLLLRKFGREAISVWAVEIRKFKLDRSLVVQLKRKSSRK